MEVRLSPELEGRLNKLADITGRAKDELVRDAIVGYFEELSSVRWTLDNRYNDFKNSRVTAIDGEDAFEALHRKCNARR
ncbi:MAG TPA: hypothetical protein VI756_18420 [Blastocatellia bacterium]